jgi:hypothetical protein
LGNLGKSKFKLRIASFRIAIWNKNSEIRDLQFEF